MHLICRSQAIGNNVLLGSRMRLTISPQQAKPSQSYWFAHNIFSIFLCFCCYFIYLHFHWFRFSSYLPLCATDFVSVIALRSLANWFETDPQHVFTRICSIVCSQKNAWFIVFKMTCTICDTNWRARLFERSQNIGLWKFFFFLVTNDITNECIMRLKSRFLFMALARRIVKVFPRCDPDHANCALYFEWNVGFSVH